MRKAFSLEKAIKNYFAAVKEDGDLLTQTIILVSAETGLKPQYCGMKNSLGCERRKYYRNISLLY